MKRNKTIVIDVGSMQWRLRESTAVEHAVLDMVKSRLPAGARNTQIVSSFLHAEDFHRHQFLDVVVEYDAPPRRKGLRPGRLGAAPHRQRFAHQPAGESSKILISGFQPPGG